MQQGQKIAIIGTGIAGMGAAWLLHQQHDIIVYEQAAHSGGHAQTVAAPDGTAIDAGFSAFSPPASPNLVALLDHLGIKTKENGVSFAVSLNDGGLEYSAERFGQLFIRRTNIFRPRFHRMWMDMLRFTVEAPRYVARNPDTTETLGEYLGRHRYSDSLVYDYILPLGAALWSMTRDAMMGFPLAPFVRFCDSSGLIRLSNRLPWRSVVGGSRGYVDKLTEGYKGRIRHRCGAVRIDRTGPKAVVLDARGAREGFDHIIIAAHADEALNLLAEPSPDERRILSAFRYGKNRAVLHQDEGLMPKNREAWASWTYLGITGGGDPKASIVSWMNRLQSLPAKENYFVSLNPFAEPKKALHEATYAHPVFTRDSLAAQANLSRIQGANRTWFCGSWCGYGFHEDALTSGLAVAEHFGVQRPWQAQDVSPAAENARKKAA